MTWAPQNQVIDLSQIADNLIGFIDRTQVEALAWAGTSGEFIRFYTNASGRLQTEFPSLMILHQGCETDLSGDVLVGDLEIALEATISGTDPDELVAETKMYAKAVESMLANIPSATLTENSDPGMVANLFEIETRLDILRGQQSPSAFLQIFQTRCVYKLVAPAF